jgi:hypothetical protein
MGIVRKIHPAPVGDAYRIEPGLCRMLDMTFRDFFTSDTVRKDPEVPSA